MLKISPFRRSKKILSAQTLAEAIRGCDTYAQSKVLPGQVALGCVSRETRVHYELTIYLSQTFAQRKVAMGACLGVAADVRHEALEDAEGPHYRGRPEREASPG